MHHRPTALVAAMAAALAALPAAQAGMYSKSSPVLQVDARSYGRLIAKSNHTSIVEFYAPWCGHCQNLKGDYEKAANNLKGLAKVAAIDCDDETNKQFCGSMGVKGFPTIKTVRPAMKPGAKPTVEDYNGPRTANAIVKDVVDKINNHVVRLTDKNLESFLSGDGPKAILFTEKGTTSALLRSIAIDFLGVISVGQIRNKEEAATKYEIEKYPSFVLFPGKGHAGESAEKRDAPVFYNGELNKKGMVDFLAEVAQPNPDPAPTEAKSKSKSKGDKGTKGDKKKKKTADKAADEPASSAESSTETTKTESPKHTPEIIPITAIKDRDVLVEKCLQPKAFTCVLALIPAEASEQGDKAVASLSQLNSKYLHGKRHLFPFFSVPSDVDGTPALRDALKLGTGVELIVINARRQWWRRFEGDDFGIESIESWIDAIRMGEGKKMDLPQGVVVEEVSEKSSTGTTQSTEATTEATAETETSDPETQEKIVHEEL